MTIKHKFSNNGTLSAAKKHTQLAYDARKKYGLSLDEVRYLRSQPCEICGIKAKKCALTIKFQKLIEGFYANNAIQDWDGLKNI